MLGTRISFGADIGSPMNQLQTAQRVGLPRGDAILKSDHIYQKH